jgi:hypothetical protein
MNNWKQEAIEQTKKDLDYVFRVELAEWFGRGHTLKELLDIVGGRGQVKPGFAPPPVLPLHNMWEG